MSLNHISLNPIQPALAGIPVVVPSGDPAPPAHGRSLGTALPILHEVRHALGRLIREGEPTCIDLTAIPFGPGDEDWLTQTLGTGEVEASVTALGPTAVRETGVPGVWLVDYRNGEGERLALHLEVTACPEILKTQGADLDTAIALLDGRLGAASADCTSYVLTSAKEGP